MAVTMVVRGRQARCSMLTVHYLTQRNICRNIKEYLFIKLAQYLFIKLTLRKTGHLICCRMRKTTRENLIERTMESFYTVSKYLIFYIHILQMSQKVV